MEHSGQSTFNKIRILRTTPILPIQNRVGQCNDCAHELKMKTQALVYYDAASLNLKQASEMNRNKVLHAKYTIAEDCTSRQHLTNVTKQQN